MQGTTAAQDTARRLKHRLRDQLKWLRLRIVGHALLMLLGGIGLLLAAALLTEPGWSRLGPAGAWVVWCGLVAAVLWVLIAEIFLPLRRVSNLMGFSRTLERFGNFDNLLEAATQFSSPRRVDPLRRGASQELVQEVLQRACAQAEAVRLTPRVPLVGVTLHVAIAAFALLVWLGAGTIGASRIASGWTSLREPSKLGNPVPERGLYAATRDVRVPVGDDLELLAHDFIGGEEPVVLEVNRTGDFWQQMSTELGRPPEHPAPYVEARVWLRRVEDPFHYRFRKGRIVSATHQVEIRERPILSSLRVRMEPPAYAGQPVEERDDPGGTLVVLEGTRVILSGMASAPLQHARRLVDGQSAVELAVEGAAFTDSFEVDQDLRFRIGLVDHEGLESQALTVYRFAVQADLAPTVEISSPGEDRHLDRDLRVQIVTLAIDDVGLDRVELVYRTESEPEWSRQALFAKGQNAESGEMIQDLTVEAVDAELSAEFIWDLGVLELLPGDAVLYAVEATDNNARKGGQTTRSLVYRLMLPTIADVFGLEREEREDDRAELGELLEEGRELEEDLERLGRELKKEPEPDWAKQQEIRETLERQKELRERLQGTVEQMEQQLDDFARNNAGSLEILEKMETIQELMSELQDESFQAYLEAMEEAMEGLLPHEIQRHMEDALAQQEEFNRRLDRTIELLRQLERERTMSDLLEEVDEHRQRQEQLAELTDPSEAEDESDPAVDDESVEQEGPEAESSQGQAEEDGAEGEQDESSDSEPSDEGSGSEKAEDETAREMSDEELQRAQEQLAEEAERLEERIREALEELRAQRERGEAQDPSAGEMEKSLEQAQDDLQEQGRPSESMREAGEELEQGDRQQAGEAQRDAIGQLLHLYEVLMQGQMAMQQATGQYAFEKLQQTAFDLLNLSFNEEEIVDALRDGVRGQRMAPIAREQGRVRRSAVRLSDELHELASKNFMISERLLAEMRALVELLDGSVEEMQLSRSGRSRDTAIETMGHMNRIVISLMTAARNSSGQGGGGSQQQMSMSEQMEQMGRDQSRLNGMTQELRRRMEQGFSEEERRQLAEMRGRQQAIREQLENLRRDMDDERRVLGDLEDLTESMERVERDLGSGELGEDLERQQEKILSRLLDAQRSIRQQDFSKRRQAETGKELFAPQTGEDLADGDAEQQRLRRWLAPDKAPHFYQEDVRRYFRNIQGQLETRERGGDR